MFSGAPPGVHPANIEVKQLEYELEMAWKRVAQRCAQCERAYTNLLKSQMEAGRASHSEFFEWQTLRAELAASRVDHIRIQDALIRASRAAQAEFTRGSSLDDSAR